MSTTEITAQTPTSQTDFLWLFQNCKKSAHIRNPEGRRLLELVLTPFLEKFFGKARTGVFQLEDDEYRLLISEYAGNIRINEIAHIELGPSRQSTTLVLGIACKPVLMLVTEIGGPQKSQTLTVVNERLAKELAWHVIRHRARKQLEVVDTMVKPLEQVRVYETDRPFMTAVAGGFYELTWTPFFMKQEQVEAFNALLKQFPAYALTPAGTLNRVMESSSLPPMGKSASETPSRTVFTTEQGKQYLDGAGEVLFFLRGTVEAHHIAELVEHTNRPSFWTAKVELLKQGTVINIVQHVQGRATPLRGHLEVHGRGTTKIGKEFAARFPESVPGLLPEARSNMGELNEQVNWEQWRRWMVCKDIDQLRRWPAMR